MPSRTPVVDQRQRHARNRHRPLPRVDAEPSAPECGTSPPAAVTVPATTHAAVLARAFVRTHLCREHARWSLPEVTLVVSELVTRALFAGVQPITVELSCTGSAARVAVSDTAPDDVEHHRDSRLLVATRVAADWGREDSGGEPMVWCTVAARDRGSPTGPPSSGPPRTRVAPPWA
ncbi:hypothetical protein SAMN05216199_0728 [Pedococcus cremeus]|uniref:ATP-binding protein n=1 Tax=Pedococcus cremeus TaxID=587636 RepID=A0A1H9QU34_9MICO|nr:hypothetical protein [Pedococcus cremeus]SER63223.1 hypothetical protein SAMN05216199_0728 [Pedococcus cremeus]